MWGALGKLGSMLDEIDDKDEVGGDFDGVKVPPSAATSSTAAAEPPTASGGAGGAFAGHRFGGLLSSAAAAAGSAAAVASSAASKAADTDWAKGAVGNLGGMTSTLNSLLGPDDDDDEDEPQTSADETKAAEGSVTGAALPVSEPIEVRGEALPGAADQELPQAEASNDPCRDVVASAGQLDGDDWQLEDSPVDVPSMSASPSSASKLPAEQPVSMPSATSEQQGPLPTAAADQQPFPGSSPFEAHESSSVATSGGTFRSEDFSRCEDGAGRVEMVDSNMSLSVCTNEETLPGTAARPAAVGAEVERALTAESSENAELRQRLVESEEEREKLQLRLRVLQDRIDLCENTISDNSSVAAEITTREEAKLCRILAEHEQAVQQVSEQCASREASLHARIEELSRSRSVEAAGDAGSDHLQELEKELTSEKLASDELRQRLREQEGLEAKSAALRQEELKAMAGAGEAEMQKRSQEQESQLIATAKQIQRLQDCIHELETENAQKVDPQLFEDSEKALKKQIEELQRDAAVTKRKATEQAAQQKEAILEEAQKDMQQEFENAMKGKDKDIRRLRGEVGTLDKTCKDQDKEMARLKLESEALREEAEVATKDGQDHRGDYQKEVTTLTMDHNQRVKELEEKKESEERQKQELALNIRSLEERSRKEIAQLEARKAELDQRHSSLQQQLDASQQQCADLSLSLGEAMQRTSHLENSKSSASGGQSEEQRPAAEKEVQQLQERLRVAEDKLIDAQAARDAFGKESDMFRSELKVARDERRYLEDELAKAQEKGRETLQLQKAAPDPPAQREVQQMQKDFEQRVERYRDEVQYLRQKCDDKEKRCEHLLAEKSSLTIELRNSSRSATAGDRAPRDLEAGAEKVGEGSGAGGKSVARSIFRTLPLTAPSWLRTLDEPLRVVVKQLAMFPAARMMFFAYVIILHIWVLLVMQMAGAAELKAEEVLERPPELILEPESPESPPT